MPLTSRGQAAWLEGESFQAACSECGNDSFVVTLYGCAHRDAQIAGVKCAICGDVTDFVNPKKVQQRMDA